MAGLPGGTRARSELAAVNRVLADRRELAITAARIAPAAYIKNELGERPSDPTKRKVWDRGVDQIEGYRQQNGVKDRSNAFGREPTRNAERAKQEAQLRLRREVQRKLGRELRIAPTRSLGCGLGIGR
jgi:hypothetical protein